VKQTPGETVKEITLEGRVEKKIRFTITSLDVHSALAKIRTEYVSRTNRSAKHCRMPQWCFLGIVIQHFLPSHRTGCITQIMC